MRRCQWFAPTASSIGINQRPFSASMTDTTGRPAVGIRSPTTTRSTKRLMTPHSLGRRCHLANNLRKRDVGTVAPDGIAPRFAHLMLEHTSLQEFFAPVCRYSRTRTTASGLLGLIQLMHESPKFSRLCLIVCFIPQGFDHLVHRPQIYTRTRLPTVCRFDF